MLDDLVKSVKAQLYDRVSSPLLASFALSWAAWNYRFILTVIASMPAPDKFSFIDSQIFPTSMDVLLRGGIYPLLTASTLIFLYPIPAKYVYRYWRQCQKELKEVQQKIDDETPLTREEARQLRREALSLSIEYDKVLQDKSAETMRLKQLIDELQNQKSAILQELPAIDDNNTTLNEFTLDESQLNMLNKIANNFNGVRKLQIIHSENDKLLAEYNLGELINGEYITQEYDQSFDDYMLTVTHKGRTALVRRMRNYNNEDNKSHKRTE